MKLYRLILISFALLSALVSCNDRGLEMEQGTGYLDLRVSRDASVDIVPVAKSGEAAADIIAVTLIPQAGGESVVIEDINQMTEPIKLKTGVYKVVATSGEDKGSAAFDAPVYYGEEQIEVRNMQVVTKEVVCTLTGVKVTVDFSSAFKASFDYKLTVSNGEASLEFSQEAGTLDKEAYFHVTDKLSWVLDVTNAKGEKFSLTDSYSQVAPRQHYDLYFDIESADDAPFGAAEFVITVDNSLNVMEYDMPIFIYPDIPVIIGPENISVYSSDVPESGDYQIVSTKGYKSVVISHNNTALTSLGLPQTTELVGASAETIQTLAAAGVQVTFTEEDIRVDAIQMLSALSVGNYSFTISARNDLDLVSTMNVNIQVKAPVEITSIVAWANFAVVKGKYYSQNLPAGFAIQHKSSGDWTDGYVLLQDVNTSAKTFKTMVCKLSAGTGYTFRLKTAKDGGLSATKSVTTEGIQTVPNLNFDQWTTGDIIYPYTGKNNGVWDTANEGLDLGNYNITKPETSSVIKGTAAKLESDYVSIFGVKKFAAGNIYTGDFVKVTTSPMGADLNWGIKFSARPVAMKGYYKYVPQTIKYTDGAHSGLKGQMDKCQIQVALTSPMSGSGTYYFYVSSGNNEFVEFSSSNSTIIAHNLIETSETITSYRSFTLPFGYRNINTRPSYIIITCCSSYLGDYFTGGDGSTMWVDEFELIYDPSDPAMSDQQRRDLFNMF